MGSMCAASVRCYAVALKAGTLLVDLDETRLPLRHSHYRYRVDGPNGLQTLTVPLVGSTNNMMTPLRDVLRWLLTLWTCPSAQAMEWGIRAPTMWPTCGAASP